MLNYMYFYKKNHSAGLPYGSLITNILAKVWVNLVEENVDTIHYQVKSTCLSKMKVHVVWWELKSDHMKEKEDEKFSLHQMKEFWMPSF